MLSLACVDMLRMSKVIKALVVSQTEVIFNCMTSVISVNTLLPGSVDFLEYDSRSSLKDHDIVIFNPRIPYYSRIYFDGGGSTVDIDSTKQLKASMAHWKSEIVEALRDGKTIFVVLDDHKIETVTNGYTSSKGSRKYGTYSVTNYDVFPIEFQVRNSIGSKIKVADARFFDLYKGLGPHMSYRVILTSKAKYPIFTTKDGKGTLGKIQKVEEYPGHMVLLPYFDLSELTETREDGEKYWTKEALGAATVLLKQVKAIDKVLRKESLTTPPPSWISDIKRPKLLSAFDKKMQKAQEEINEAVRAKVRLLREKIEVEEFQNLLFETGTVLEAAIERSLRLFGYEVSNFRKGDLEIDHMIISPKGARFIGEAEGKDTSAVDVSKFRQLETNIGEDFEREDVDEAATGMLFGNGYRLSEPKDRGVQFTEKCLKNAKRRGTILVQTADMYPAVIYLQDHPDDEEFKRACRDALETSTGNIVVFPSIPTKKK